MGEETTLEVGEALRETKSILHGGGGISRLRRTGRASSEEGHFAFTLDRFSDLCDGQRADRDSQTLTSSTPHTCLSLQTKAHKHLLRSLIG